MLIGSLRSVYCACHCKDTHFEAIHNGFSLDPLNNNIVLATAKIHILKQFTTASTNRNRFLYCACHCKDTHFEAIHNLKAAQTLIADIVLATAKIHILKQFTTCEAACRRPLKLCLPLQRYTFWSNSQQCCCAFVAFFYCACHCKDTHFEAIHNLTYNMSFAKGIVLATAKIHILKQFTTTPMRMRREYILCLPLQRYTFWSNSQRWEFWFYSTLHCACHCKDTHFEAIHNHSSCRCFLEKIVLATAKIHILKQFTTLILFSTPLL